MIHLKKTLRQTLFAIALLSLGAVSLPAQQPLTIEVATPGSNEFYESFYPDYLSGLTWLQSTAIWRQEATLQGCTPEGKKSALLTIEDLFRLVPSDEYFARLKSYGKAFPYYQALECGLLAIYGDNVYLIDVAQQKLVRTFPRKDADQQPYELLEFDPNGAYVVARSTKGVLGILTPTQFTEIATNEGNEIVYGEAVHQREFGIEKGIFISPKGDQVAFYRMDQSMVPEYPIVDYISNEKAEVKPLRYPMAGDRSHHVTIGIYKVATGKTIYLEAPSDKETFLTNIAWTPDAKQILVAEVARHQDRCTLNEYDATSGHCIRTLFEESDPKYVEPQTPAIFLNDGTGRFLWLSRRDGFNHIYLYDRSGKLLKQITKGDWEVLEVKGFADKKRQILFTSTKASPLEERFYSVAIKSGKLTDLTPQRGVHSVVSNEEGTAFIDQFTSPEVARRISLINTKGKKPTTLLDAKDKTKAFVMPTVTLDSLTADDGATKLYYRVIKPSNFDPAKKYPLILYVYGGPHAQMINCTPNYGAGGWELYMAEQGYIMLCLDNRGSANRGKAFEDVIHRQVGTVEMRDQIKGVRHLMAEPWVDNNRIGVYGWSFGGFMTTNLMLSYPEIFKVGVAGGPVMDWRYYEIMYGERYNDMPQENPEGYKANNLTLRAGDLKGRLLLIHGVIDNVVLWQHAQRFVQAAIKAGTLPDTFYYPTHEHNVRGNDRVHLNKVITRYFQDHL